MQSLRLVSPENTNCRTQPKGSISLLYRAVDTFMFVTKHKMLSSFLLEIKDSSNNLIFKICNWTGLRLSNTHQLNQRTITSA